MAFIYNLSDAWNDAGTTYTSIKMNVLDTASNAASLLMDLQVGGVTAFNVSKSGAISANSNLTLRDGIGSSNRIAILNTTGYATRSGGAYTWGSGATDAGGSPDLLILRDAANTLAQRNGVNAQTSRIYNTYTDVSNYERVALTWTANKAILKVENAGTGSARNLRLECSSGSLEFHDGNSTMVMTSGTLQLGNRRLTELRDLIFQTDNTYDIGASGATRPRNLYMGSWIRMATTTVASLPAAATAGAGARMFVTDAASPTFGSAVAGGGAVTVPVYSTGSAWNVG
jgi:hypothetical protein